MKKGYLNIQFLHDYPEDVIVVRGKRFPELSTLVLYINHQIENGLVINESVEIPSHFVESVEEEIGYKLEYLDTIVGCGKIIRI